MKIAFLTLGCKLNYAETSTYERGFLQAGWEAVSPKEKADVYLINTCSVTATSDSKSRNLIRKVHRLNPLAYIVVTGCSAQLRRTEIEGIDGVSRVFGAHEKQNVVSETLEAVGGGHGFRSVATAGTDGVFGAFSTGERTRSFLKVQDGCSNYCAYCTVPYARGESRNIPISECLAGARAIAAEGVKEIVLTGVNTGDFGRTTGEKFLDLLKALNGVEGIERYRISSIEPNLLTEETVAWIASGTRFQPHFHIPLQSGSDEILRRMGRRYDSAAFYDKLSMVRRLMEAPGRLKVFFGIDLMTGLPGESEALFRESCDFVRSCAPAFIHVFPYSRRPGTPAASMPGQVSEEVKKERVAVLEELCAQLHGDFVAAHKGMHARVLFESKEKDGSMGGYTENYIRVTRPWDQSLSGQIADVVI